jgi:hypothetical protein
VSFKIPPKGGEGVEGGQGEGGEEEGGRGEGEGGGDMGGLNGIFCGVCAPLRPHT